MDGPTLLLGQCHFTHKQLRIISEKSKLPYITISVAGFSLEFALLNPAGFYFYTFYSTIGIIDPRFGTGKVEINDLVFAVHAVALSTVQLMQVFIFPVSK